MEVLHCDVQRIKTNALVQLLDEQEHALHHGTKEPSTFVLLVSSENPAVTLIYVKQNYLSILWSNQYKKEQLQRLTMSSSLH